MVALGTSPAAVYGDTDANTSLVTASFTPASGTVVVAKVYSADASQTHSTPTATGLTFTSQANVGTANASTRVSLWTAIGAGSAVTVTAAFAGTVHVRGLVVEVYTSAQLAGTPAVHSVTSGSGAPSDTITTVAANSLVSWASGDWAQISTTPTYRSSATSTAYHSTPGQYTVYGAWQTAATAGSQTYGLSAPAGQTFTMAAIEIQDSAGATASAPFRRVGKRQW